MSVVFHHVLKQRTRLRARGPSLVRQKGTAAATVDQIPALNGCRANCGKSTLLNAVLGRKDLLRTSKKAGCTRTLNFYRVGEHPGSVVLVDAPGYGARGRPEWGDLFNSYITTRKQLKRIYILFNGKHLLNAVDLEMLANLSGTLFSKEGTQTYTLQAIITKVDCIPSQSLDQVIPKIQKQIWEAAPLCLSPIITSAMMRPMFGVDAVRRDIAEAAGLVLKK
ncbi:hypothetical protein B0H13DRAFT_2070856 [Mycena leptocephala]|nr:hypothetical protein B0H13DRAFT_2070856 [Mycena leptocephala]